MNSPCESEFVTSVSEPPFWKLNEMLWTTRLSHEYTVAPSAGLSVPLTSSALPFVNGSATGEKIVSAWAGAPPTATIAAVAIEARARVLIDG
jgi:hypothetical protein